MRAIAKYRVHPSIIAIKEKCNSSIRFNFLFVDEEDILKEIKNLKANKAIQNTDIPTKSIKENSDIFADIIFENLNDSISLPISIKTSKYTGIKTNKYTDQHYN